VAFLNDGTNRGNESQRPDNIFAVQVALVINVLAIIYLFYVINCHFSLSVFSLHMGCTISFIYK
jgi:hypothetical protein